MSSPRWQQVETLYHEALEHDSGARSAFLARACAEDEELLREVEALLSYERRAEGFIDRPAFEIAARALAEDPKASVPEPPREIGRYKLLSLLGTGGMGEVFLALDTRLSRKVAIKLLPLEFAADPERVRRFEQEARAVSALNHPNIVTVFEIGETDGRHYIVSEFVDGETLRQRLAESPGQRLRPSEALEIAAQTASALQTAHDAKIIHRDVKPENVMVRKDGLVKVLDFGLAKIGRPQAEQQLPPSIERLSTNSGIVMGTVTYMSPEQVRGEKVDHRTDVFSFGVILYEMFAGRRPFDAPTASDVIVSVLTKDPPPLGQLAPEAPVQLQAIVNRCLEKQPEKRFQSASDLGFALRALNGPLHAPPSAETESPRGRLVKRTVSSALDRVRQAWLGRALIAVFAVLFLIAVVLAITHLLERPEDKVSASFSINLPENWRFRWFDGPAVSPDGKYVVFGAVPTSEQTGRTTFLWVRSLDSNNAKTLPGTEGGISPFWSPDSRFVAFWSNGKLKKIDLAGTAVTICETPPTLSGTWNKQGVILFSQEHMLRRVSANGGRAALLGPLADGEKGQYGPRFLPDGKHFLYYSHNQDSKKDGIYVSSIDPGVNRKFVLGEALTAAYVAPGYLLFNKREMLMAQQFDLAGLEVTGEPVLVADQIAGYGFGKPDSPLAAFSVSENGVLMWKLKTEETVGTQLTWMDRSGRRLGTIGETAGFSGPAFSPDQKRLAVARFDPGTKARDLWIMDMFGGALSRFSFSPADDLNPVWTPDGKSIIFTSTQKGKRDIYRRPVDGTAEPELLLESNGDKNVEDISPDGRYLIINTRANEDQGPDLSLLPLTGERKVSPLVATQFREDQAQFSPDGRWIVYRGEENGSSEVFVRGFSREGVLTAGKWRVSDKGGCQPRWRGDGKELYYLRGNHVMSVDINAEGSAFSAAPPRQLFDVNIEPEERRNRFVVTRDGQRFLVIALTEATGGSTVGVRLNWFAPVNP